MGGGVGRRDGVAAAGRGLTSGARFSDIHAAWCAEERSCTVMWCPPATATGVLSRLARSRVHGGFVVLYNLLSSGSSVAYKLVGTACDLI